MVTLVATVEPTFSVIEQAIKAKRFVPGTQQYTRCCWQGIAVMSWIHTLVQDLEDKADTWRLPSG